MSNLDLSPDESLVLRVVEDSDQEALSQLYQRYNQLVYGYFLKRIGNVDEALDLTSEVFLKMIQGLDKFEGRASFKNWLFGIVKHSLMDKFRSYYQAKELPLADFMNYLFAEKNEEFTEEDEKREESERKKLFQVVEQLPVDYQTVIKCRFLEGLTLKETASKMNKKPNHIKVLQYRAVKKAAAIAQNL